MDEFYKQDTEQKNPKIKCLAHDPVHINFTSRQSRSLVLDSAYPWGGQGDAAVSWQEHGISSGER